VRVRLTQRGEDSQSRENLHQSSRQRIPTQVDLIYVFRKMSHLAWNDVRKFITIPPHYGFIFKEILEEIFLRFTSLFIKYIMTSYRLSRRFSLSVVFLSNSASIKR
jgi:hypothetical protein